MGQGGREGGGRQCEYKQSGPVWDNKVTMI